MNAREIIIVGGIITGVLILPNIVQAIIPPEEEEIIDNGGNGNKNGEIIEEGKGKLFNLRYTQIQNGQGIGQLAIDIRNDGNKEQFFYLYGTANQRLHQEFTLEETRFFQILFAPTWPFRTSQIEKIPSENFVEIKELEIVDSVIADSYIIKLRPGEVVEDIRFRLGEEAWFDTEDMAVFSVGFRIGIIDIDNNQVLSIDHSVVARRMISKPSPGLESLEMVRFLKPEFVNFISIENGEVEIREGGL